MYDANDSDKCYYDDFNYMIDSLHLPLVPNRDYNDSHGVTLIVLICTNGTYDKDLNKICFDEKRSWGLLFRSVCAKSSFCMKPFTVSHVSMRYVDAGIEVAQNCSVNGAHSGSIQFGFENWILKSFCLCSTTDGTFLRNLYLRRRRIARIGLGRLWILNLKCKFH